MEVYRLVWLAGGFGRLGGLARAFTWLVQQLWEREANLECYSWSERVPSASNIADHPSRGVLVVKFGG